MLTSSTYTKPQHLFYPSSHKQSSTVQTKTATMSVSLSPFPLLRFPSNSSTSLKFHDHKEKVIIVMGATGTGKSRLSIDIATQFAGEIVNSDKIQLYNGLDILTNKVTPQECRGIPHHLLGILHNNDATDFTSSDFCNLATITIESITGRDRVPIIAGGSNSLIDALVNNHPSFSKRYECCFLWVDVALPVLGSFISDRVDKMVKQGMIDEVSEVFDRRGDYSKGIKRAIGVPEMHKFLEAKGNGDCDKDKLSDLFQEGVNDIKGNTYRLACKQLERIQRLKDFWGWDMHRIDATEVFKERKRRNIRANDKVWEELVVSPSVMIVDQFLNDSVRYSSASSISHVIPRCLPVPAMAAAASY